MGKGLEPISFNAWLRMNKDLDDSDRTYEAYKYNVQQDLDKLKSYKDALKMEGKYRVLKASLIFKCTEDYDDEKVLSWLDFILANDLPSGFSSETHSLEDLDESKR